MSRKNKTLRAFLHQNENPTIEQVWDHAWKGAQKEFHARSMQDMEATIERLVEVAKRVVSIVHPHPSEDTERYREELELVELARTLLAKLQAGKGGE